MCNVGYITTEPNIHICGYENLDCNKDLHRVVFQEEGKERKIINKFKLCYDQDGHKYFNLNGRNVYILQ